MSIYPGAAAAQDLCNLGRAKQQFAGEQFGGAGAYAGQCVVVQRLFAGHESIISLSNFAGPDNGTGKVV